MIIFSPLLSLHHRHHHLSVFCIFISKNFSRLLIPAERKKNINLHISISICMQIISIGLIIQQNYSIKFTFSLPLLTFMLFIIIVLVVLCVCFWMNNTILVGIPVGIICIWFLFILGGWCVVLWDIWGLSLVMDSFTHYVTPKMATFVPPSSYALSNKWAIPMK